MKFVDLFAGIGGFHVAAGNLPIETECVFACEIDEAMSSSYEVNFNKRPAGDIRKVDLNSIPNFDILFGGWPCQPFSNNGYSRGFNDADKGDLFFYIERFLRHFRPRYFLLENVVALIQKRHVNEMSYIMSVFKELNYDVIPYTMSPHQFGVPQDRRRVFFMGQMDRKFTHIIEPYHNINDLTLTSFGTSLRDILIPDEHVVRYPVLRTMTLRNIRRHRANHNITKGENFIYQYGGYANGIARVSIGLDRGIGGKDVCGTIQVSRDTWPVHLKKPYRYLSPREGARLQSFPDTHRLPQVMSKGYKAVGNAINVKVAQRILEFHLCDIHHSNEVSIKPIG